MYTLSDDNGNVVMDTQENLKIWNKCIKKLFQCNRDKLQTNKEDMDSRTKIINEEICFKKYEERNNSRSTRNTC